MASFSSLGLRAELQFGLNRLKYRVASECQVEFVAGLRKGRDILGQARSGTGKSLGYIVGALQMIDLEELSPQVVVLTPTHELAIQIGEQIEKVGEAMKVVVRVCIGGTNVRGDIQALHQGNHIVVGTLGRLYDMLSNKHLEFQALKLLVIDDADMLGVKKYKGQFNYILNYLPKNTQKMFVSTTFPEKFKKFALAKMMNPVKIEEKLTNLCPKNVSQYFSPLADAADRQPAFLRLLSQLQGRKTLVFCKAMYADLEPELKEKGIKALFHHSEKNQSKREAVVSAFRKKKDVVLVNSGLLARGLDVTDVEVVVMYDLPSAVEYIHCIGRCGRYGRKGLAISLADPSEIRFLKNIERRHRVTIRELPEDVPGLLNP